MAAKCDLFLREHIEPEDEAPADVEAEEKEPPEPPEATPCAQDAPGAQAIMRFNLQHTTSQGKICHTPARVRMCPKHRRQFLENQLPLWVESGRLVTWVTDPRET